MTRRPWLLWTAVLLLTACERNRNIGDFDRLDFRNVSSAPGLVELRPNEIVLERGMAVRARVSALDPEGDPLDLLSLRSVDPSICTVDLGPRLGEYVFHGAVAGQTDIDVLSDGHWVGSVPIEVLEQRP